MCVISRAQELCFTLRIVQKYCSTPAVQIPPKSIQFNSVICFLPACISPFTQSSFLSQHRSLGSFQCWKNRFFCLFRTASSSHGLCGCGKLRPACEIWDEYRVHQGQCQGLNASQLWRIRVWWLRSRVRNSCLYSWGLTWMLAGGNLQCLLPTNTLQQDDDASLTGEI